MSESTIVLVGPYKVDVRKGEGLRRTVAVELPATLLADRFKDLIAEYAAAMGTKGFRKGKIPSSLVVRRFGEDRLRNEAMQRVVAHVGDALGDDERLAPAGDAIEWQVVLSNDDAMVLSAEYEVMPSVSLERLGGFRVERPRVVVDAADVERAIETLRETRTTWTPVESGRPETGDRVSVRLTRLDGREDEDPGDEDGAFDFVLGRDKALEDVEAAVRALSPGEADDVDVVFPEDFHDERRAGARHRVRVELLGRCAPERPELDDDFARSLGDGDIESLEALTEVVARAIEHESESEAQSDARFRLLREVAKANVFEVPESWVDAFVRQRVEKTFRRAGREPKPEDVREACARVVADTDREEFETMVRMAAIQSEIIQKYGLRPSKREVVVGLKSRAREDGVSYREALQAYEPHGGIDFLRDRMAAARCFQLLESESEIVVAAPDEAPQPNP